MPLLRISVLRFAFIVSSLLCVTCLPLFGVDPADSAIRNALGDVERFEAQFPAGRTISASAAKRTLKLLKLTEQRLAGSTNHSHPSWAETNQRLLALTARLQAAANGNHAPSQAVPQPAAPVAQSAPARTQASGSSMISQQRVRVKKLKRDIESTTDSLDKGGVGPFQDPAYVQKMDDRASYYAEHLARYDEFASDPDVVAAADSLQVFRNMIAFGKQTAAEQTAGLGDVQARLKEIETERIGVPETPRHPYPGRSVSEWLVALAKSRQQAVAQVTQLAEIAKTAYLPNTPGTVQQGAPYDANDLNRLDRAYRSDIAEIDQELQTFSVNLDAQVSHILDTLQYFDELDPSDRNDQANAFLSEGKAEQNWERLQADLRLAAVAVTFDTQLKRPQLEEHSLLFKRIEKTMEAFKTSRQKALELARMPEAASTDSGLEKIARETLAASDLEVGDIKKLVINSDIRQLEKETSETEFDDADVSIDGTVTLSGTKTTYRYEWEQFQVATAEPLGDKHYIFYNTFKKYSMGDHMTPIGRWIVSGRMQSIEILPENID